MAKRKFTYQDGLLTMKKIIMYTSNYCPFCSNAEQLFKNKGFSIDEKIYIDRDPDELSKMMEATGKRTVPQIFIGDHHVGGNDQLQAANTSGELDKLLA